MDREKLTEEILGYLDGQLSEEGERALAARIRGDAEAERLLADLMRLHGNMAAVLQERAGERAARREMAATPTPPGGVPRVRRFRPRVAGTGPSSAVWMWSVAGGVAACLMIAIAVSVPGGKRPDRPTAVRPQKVVLEPEPSPSPTPVAPLEMPKPSPKPLPAPVVTPENPLRPDPVPPPPAPAPRPEEPRPGPAPSKTTVAEAPPKPVPAALLIESLKGEVLVLAAGTKAPAREGQALLPGQALQTAGAESSAAVKIADGTRLELGGDTTLSEIAEAGKKVFVESGTVTAKVAKQPAGQSMVFTTSHAEARILGTVLKLTVDPQGTKLEVTEGRVRFTRRKDGATVDVGAGSYAVAAPGPRPVARKIGTPLPGRFYMIEDFEEAAGVRARWQTLEGGFPTTTAGGIDVDLSPRAGDSYAGGGWHLAGGLRTKQAFPIPFRVTVDVEVSHRDDAVNALLVLVPASQKGGVVLKNEIAVRVRGGEHGLLIEGEKVKLAEGSWKAPLRERWTLEVDATEVKALVDGREFHRQAHKLTITEDYRVELQGAAKMEAPKGAKVRFDNLKIEP